MRTLKLATALLVAFGASILAMAAASVASAASILPGVKGTLITGGSGKLTLQVKGGASITCTKSTTSGEIVSTSQVLLLTIGSFCTSGGLPVNTLGDSSGQILIHIEAPPCLTISFPPSISITLEFLQIHVEVPLTKLLILTRGAAIAPVLPDNTRTKHFTLSPSQKEGKQSIEKCEGGVARTLETSTDSGEFVQTGLEAKEGTLDFAAEEEFMS